MKKWMYLIVPVVLMGIFLVFYLSHVEEAHKKEAALKARVAAEKAEADRKKKEAEDKARADAKRRQEEREAEERRKEEEKLAKQRADDEKVRAETAKHKARGDAAAKLVEQREIELDRLRKEKDRLSRETFEIEKQVELARIARRNAELEIQRMTEMVAQRAHNSSLTRPPMVAPPAPARSQ